MWSSKTLIMLVCEAKMGKGGRRDKRIEEQRDRSTRLIKGPNGKWKRSFTTFMTKPRTLRHSHRHPPKNIYSHSRSLHGPAKGLKAQGDLAGAVEGMQEVLMLEAAGERGEWGFKALKQSVKMLFALGQYEVGMMNAAFRRHGREKEETQV